MTRIPYDKVRDAISSGLNSRFVFERTRDQDLIANDLKTMMTSRYRKEDKTFQDFALLALATMSWNGYDHVMRQMLPVTNWMLEDDVTSALEFLRRCASKHTSQPLAYGIRQTSKHEDDTLITCRVVASSPENCWHFTWGEEFERPTNETLCQTMVRAALHARKTCLLVDLKNKWMKRITVPDKNRVFRLMD